MRRAAALLVFALVATLLTLAAPGSAAATNRNSVNFSVSRGYITEPITVELTGAANIVYSTAWGSEWLASDFAAIAQPYTGPITISGTTQLRAMAVGDEHAVSHTYVDISNYSAQDQALIQSYPAAMTTGGSLGSRSSDARTIVEFWHPNGSSAHAPAGIRNRQGGAAQNGDFRLYFRDEYGDGRLDHDLFPDEPAGAQPARAYDKVNLHGGSQDRFGFSWSYNGCNPGTGTMMRDRFFQRLQRQLNGDGPSGEYYLMWDRDRFVGIKNAEDVPQQGFMDEHFGGDKDNYGLWTWYSRELPSGNPYSSGNVTSFMNSVDLVNYADYLLVMWFSGNTDWASTNRNNNVVVGGLFDGPYYHWTWDSHATDPGCTRNWGAVPINTANPLSNIDMRMVLADRALLHFGDGGAMTSTSLLETWDALADELAPAVPLVYTESAWRSAEQSMRNRVGSAAPSLYTWLRQSGYASSIDPVEYSLPAGNVASGSTVTLSGGDEIWFTLDGTDPRAAGGAVSDSALRYSEEIALPDGTVQMLARVKSGDAWSAARPMIYRVDAASVLISEATAGYVEITNQGTTAVDLEYWRLQGDVRFKFDYDRSPIIQPGETIVLADNADVFEARWGRPADGEFLDKVNGTSLLRLVDTELVTQHEIVAPLYTDGVPGDAQRPTPEAGDPPGLILNEWNAVSNSNTPSDPDPRLGTVTGNGGDWFEVVTVNDVDLRGWQLEASDADSVATIELSNNSLWSDIPAGAIITFSENRIVAEDGTIYDTDTSLDPDNGDWWIHIVTGEANPYTNQTNFPASADDWSLRITDDAGDIRWGPVGEGLGALAGGVGTSEVGELEADPSPALDPVTAPYDDGNGSTFGAPNSFGGRVQIFAVLRGEVITGADADCDAALDVADALFIVQYTVDNRVDAGRCPLADPATQVNAAAGDVNLDGVTNAVDALLIHQCSVGIDNGFCLPE